MLKQVNFYRAMMVCVLMFAGFVVTSAQQSPTQNQGKPNSPSSGQGQSPKPAKGAEIKEGEAAIKEQTDVVTLTVTVTDTYDRLVTGLERRHFEIFEDKVKQNIEYFTDDDAPVSVGIVFDVSGSMKGKIDRAREALKAFIQTSHDKMISS